MTGPCSGAGVGTPKAGFGVAQAVGIGGIAGALAGLSGWEGALVGATIGLLQYDLSTFCPGGPAAMPTFTLTDITDLLQVPPNAGYPAARQKFQDFIGNLLWPTFCFCSSGAPVLAAPAAYPAGAPQAQAPLGQSSPCASGSSDSGPLTSNSSLLMFASDTLGLNPTSYRVTMTLTNVTPPGFNGHFSLFWQDQTQSPVVTFHTQQFPVVQGATSVQVLPQYAGTNLLSSEFFCNSGTGSVDATIKIEAFCNGDQPGGQLQPCCPPDIATQAQLQAILDTVTLIQRQMAPFGYVASTSHPGLSGAGSIAISDLIGVRVVVTTDSPYLGVEGTSPPELFDRGWITFATSDGALKSSRLEHPSQLELPCSAGAYTLLYYDLAPNIIVTITELVREP